MSALRPGLDLAQILPTLVYLAPLALVFLWYFARGVGGTFEFHRLEQAFRNADGGARAGAGR